MNKKRLVLTFFVSIVVISFILLAFMMASRGEVARESIDRVSIKKDGGELIVNKNGFVRYEKDGQVFEDEWSEHKTNTFFNYIENNYAGESQIIAGGQNFITINKQTQNFEYELGEDELIDIVEDETTGSGGQGNGNDGGDENGNGGNTGGGNNAGGNSNDGGGGGGSNGGGNPGGQECLYWRISYCVRARTPTPAPSEAPPEVEIRQPNCEENTQTGRTVIGNELCLPAVED